MQMQGNSRYFIAVIPPDDICRDVTAFKEDMALHYNSKKALRIMPHITLKAPFITATNRDAEVLDWFKNLPIKTLPFEIALDGFGAFDNSRNPVIFVKPLLNPGLTALQNEVISGFTQHFTEIPVHFNEQDYHPHMTIAYRDLAYAGFKKAWAAYAEKTYLATFTTSCFFLLKHNGLCWEIALKKLL